jgi:hypothetical protein
MIRTEDGLFLVYALMIEQTQNKIIHNSKPLFFSSREKAVEIIKNYQNHFPFLYDRSQTEAIIYCLVLEHFALDSPHRYQLSTSVFSPEGVLICDSIVPDDGPFFGREKEAILHQIGEIVEVPFGNRLCYGIVVEQPVSISECKTDYGLTASDDCYGVMCYPDNEIFYAHTPLVFKPTESVSNHIRESLLSNFGNK